MVHILKFTTNVSFLRLEKNQNSSRVIFTDPRRNIAWSSISIFKSYARNILVVDSCTYFLSLSPCLVSRRAFFKESTTNFPRLVSREEHFTEQQTKHSKINAEKSPYLCEKLNIWMMPSIVLIKNRKTEHTIVGFDELGGTDKFTSYDMSCVLARHGMVELDNWFVLFFFMLLRVICTKLLDYLQGIFELGSLLSRMLLFFFYYN